MFLKINISDMTLLTKVLLTRINYLSSFPLLSFYSVFLIFLLINIESSQLLKNYEDSQWSYPHFGLSLQNNEFCLCLARTLTLSLVFFWMMTGDLEHKKFTIFSVFIPLNLFHLHICFLPMNCPYLFIWIWNPNKAGPYSHIDMQSSLVQGSVMLLKPKHRLAPTLIKQINVKKCLSSVNDTLDQWQHAFQEFFKSLDCIRWLP